MKKCLSVLGDPGLPRPVRMRLLHSAQTLPSIQEASGLCRTKQLSCERLNNHEERSKE
jgi:hypothetical protein